MDALECWDALTRAGLVVQAGVEPGECYVMGAQTPEGPLRAATRAHRFALAGAAKLRDELKAAGRDACSIAFLVRSYLRDGSSALMLGADPGRLSRGLGRRSSLG